MPSKSKAQHNLMAMVANDPKAAKRLGIPKSVGKEFINADKGKTFKEGGEMKKDAKKLFGGKETYKEEMKEAKAIKSGKITPREYAMGEESEKKMKKGGKTKCMAKGGVTRADGCVTKGHTKGKMV